MTTVVPPEGLPTEGLMPVTIGRGAIYVNWSAFDVALVPPAVVTVTWTVDADMAGLTATICVSVFEVMLVAARAPNMTDVAKSSPVPVIVTEVPPLVRPLVGLIPLTTGVGATYVKRSPGPVALVPWTVTVMSTAPPGWAGLVAVI
jgi:hypothetical protein